MTEINVRVSEAVLMQLESRAKESGHPTIEEYFEAFVRNGSPTDQGDVEASIDYGAPERVKIRTAADVERLAAERADPEGSFEYTPAFIAEMRAYGARLASERKAGR